MSWSALITSIVLTILLASPFQWFLGAGKDTFIRREPSPGAAWGQASFASGIMAVAWVGLFGGLSLGIATIGALGLAAASVALYEWARRTVGPQRLAIGLSGQAPAAVVEAGPYRHFRHPFYLSYLLAFAAVALAMRSRLGVAVALANIVLFVVMALHDERGLARSPLAADYAAYRRRVGILLLLPRRARA
jgi:protein-S-isoprenylcysteine O-methyltransferase Ste14